MLLLVQYLEASKGFENALTHLFKRNIRNDES